MWFDKWFRRPPREAEDDEPARFSAPERTPPAPAAARPAASEVQKKGFDPYNSGAFKRQNAWERVNRR